MYKIFTESRKLRFLMRVSFIYVVLLICGIQLLSASNTKGQSLDDILVNIEIKDKSLETIIKKIELQTRLRFAYLPSEVSKYGNVVLRAGKQSVKSVLDQALQHTSLGYKYIENSIILFPRNKEQLFSKNEKELDVKVDVFSEGHLNVRREEKAVALLNDNRWVEMSNKQLVMNITGQVIDQSGQALIGVNVLVKGTDKGTATDFDGNFNLSDVDENAVLIVSYIGYQTQEVALTGKSKVTITLLEDSQTLDEVVVVGYGTQKKGNVTGSVAQTSGAELRTSPAANLSQSLAGRLAGVTINTRNGEPGRDDATIYVRGLNTTGNNTPLFVIDGIADGGNISRIDPEDIESVTVLKDASAAIYGARAANGVILVTTKRGTEEKPTISFTYNHGFVNPTKIIKMADAGLYSQALYDAENNLGRLSHTYSLEDIQKFKDGTSPLTHPNTDWFNEVFRTLSNQSRENISLRGGSGSIKYFLSLGHSKQQTLYNYSDNYFEQFNFRANIDANITENFSIGFNLSGRKDDGQWIGGNDSYIFWLSQRNAPTEHAVFPNGEFSQGLASINPIALIDGSGYRLGENDMYQGVLSFKYLIPKLTGFYIDGFAAIDNANMFDKNFQTPWNYSIWDPVNNTYEHGISGIIPNVNLRQDYSKNSALTMNIKLNYGKEFNNHSLNGFVAYEQNKAKGSSFWTSRDQFDSKIIDQLFAGTSDKTFFNNSGSGYETARQNYFGRVSYNYNHKYMADLNVRYDGSMNFPKDQRFGLFPGISIAWRISEEPFLMGVKFIDDLKLRASVGKLGNDRIPSFSYLRKFGFGDNYVFGGNDVTGITETGVAIPNITWETTTSSNLGFDLTFFNSRMSMEFDVFRNLTRGMLISRSLAIPGFAGFSPPRENAGEMENKGFEIFLNYHENVGEIQLNISGNMGFSRNKVLYIDEVINPDAPWQAQTGKKLNRRLIYDVIGIFRSQGDLDKYPHFPTSDLGDLIYRDVNDDGEINGLDRISSEFNEIPEIMYGFNLGVIYKNFDLTALFQGQARVDQPVGRRFNFTGNTDERQLSDYWVEDNPDAKFPRPGLNDNYYLARPSNFWLESAAFLRLKTIQLGYNIPKSFVSKIGLDGCHAYISGFNLLTLAKIKIQDPEVTDPTGERTTHPQSKIFNVGFKVTF